MDICGIDLLLDDNGSFVVCEANANVGFTEFDQACQLDLGGIIADYAISLLCRLPSKEAPGPPAESSPPETGEMQLNASTSTLNGSDDGSSCSHGVCDVEDIRDSNVPKPCKSALTDALIGGLVEK